MTDVVFISGKQGSGKTTISNELVRQAKVLKYSGIKQIKFAEPLYVLHEYILNKMEGWTGKPRVPKDGPLLQLLGTEWGRETIDQDLWVKIALREISKYDESHPDSKNLVIIDDGRFPNEFDNCTESLRVRLECPEEVRKARCPAWRDNTNHLSEIALDEYAAAGKFDLYLDTSGDDLIKCVSLINAQLQKKRYFMAKKILLSAYADDRRKHKRNFLWYHPGYHEWVITNTLSVDKAKHGWQYLGELI
jgi:hypothetical protein